MTSICKIDFIFSKKNALGVETRGSKITRLAVTLLSLSCIVVGSLALKKVVLPFNLSRDQMIAILAAGSLGLSGATCFKRTKYPLDREPCPVNSFLSKDNKFDQIFYEYPLYDEMEYPLMQGKMQDLSGKKSCFLALKLSGPPGKRHVHIIDDCTRNAGGFCFNSVEGSDDLCPFESKDHESLLKGDEVKGWRLAKSDSPPSNEPLNT